MRKMTVLLSLALMAPIALAAPPTDEKEHFKWAFEVNAMHVAAATACGDAELGAQLHQSTMELLAVHPLSDPRILGVNQRTFDNRVASYISTSRQFTRNDGANCPNHLRETRVRIMETDKLIVKYVSQAR